MSTIELGPEEGIEVHRLQLHSHLPNQLLKVPLNHTMSNMLCTPPRRKPLLVHVKDSRISVGHGSAVVHWM